MIASPVIKVMRNGLMVLGWSGWVLSAWCQTAAPSLAATSPDGSLPPRRRPLSSQQPSTVYATSYQVNVDALGQNIVGDAASEPSLCVDPTNPNRIAIGWRQFDSVTNDFRQAGWAYSTNGGLSWTFPGVLETNVFRSDPVLAADADGRFYYLSVLISPTYHCDLWQSTNGGMSWQPAGFALGGDKPWMVIDTTTGGGRGTIYQTWSRWFNYTNDPNAIFSRSVDSGQTWMEPVSIPQLPYWGTLDVGPQGELYAVGWDGSAFWMGRSTNAPDQSATPAFDLITQVGLGGGMIFQMNTVNPEGLVGQAWIAADRSSGPTRGNVYVLCSVSGTGNPANVMFARSTDGGMTWSAPQRINDDSPTQNAWHWFGTLAVAPNGRIDVCWNDTRSNTNSQFSELYYSSSLDGGLTWSPNRAISPPFNHTLGYPVQKKMGDYITMVSLNDAARIAYAATFNGEEDIYFVRVEPPIVATVAKAGVPFRLSWNTVAGRTYGVQFKGALNLPWSASNTLGSLVATGIVATMDDPSAGSSPQRVYRVIQPP
ncbi:MAG: sialidase family protein [Limisphaerales bacterium]